jgi:hypothetical protein
MSLTGETPIDIPAEPADGAGAPEHVAASLYAHHLFAARHLADLACTLEKEHAGAGIDDDISGRHRTYVIGAVLLASAFLEASINELYLEVQGHIVNGNRGGRQRVLAVPAHFWSSVGRPPVLHKYQLALVVADAEPYDEGRSPFREADGLIALRDALVHGRPEWRDSHGRRQNLERRLRGKFPHNPFAIEGDPEFPDRMLSAGCAMWAVRVVEKFSDDFCHRMAIPSRVMTSRDR